MDNLTCAQYPGPLDWRGPGPGNAAPTAWLIKIQTKIIYTAPLNGRGIRYPEFAIAFKSLFSGRFRPRDHDRRPGCGNPATSSLPVSSLGKFVHWQGYPRSGRTPRALQVLACPVLCLADRSYGGYLTPRPSTIVHVLRRVSTAFR